MRKFCRRVGVMKRYGLDHDVLAAQTLGMTGVLTRTGKFRQEHVEASDDRPDHVVDSIADVPAALGLA